VDSELTMAGGLFLVSQFYSIDMHDCSTIPDTCYYNFVAGFEIEKYEPLNFVLFKDVLTILSHLNFHVKYRISLSISAKKPSGVLTGIVNLQITLESMTMSTVLSLLIHERGF
jgi:hypothetical protein